MNGLRTTPSPDPVKKRKKKGARMKIKGGGDTERGRGEVGEDNLQRNRAGPERRGARAS